MKKVLLGFLLLIVIGVLYYPFTLGMITQLVVPNEKLRKPILYEYIEGVEKGKVFTFDFKVNYRGPYYVYLWFNPRWYNKKNKGAQQPEPQYKLKFSANIKLFDGNRLILGKNNLLTIEPWLHGASILSFWSAREVPLNKNITLRLEIIELDEGFAKWYENMELSIRRESAILR